MTIQNNDSVIRSAVQKAKKYGWLGFILFIGGLAVAYVCSRYFHIGAVGLVGGAGLIFVGALLQMYASTIRTKMESLEPETSSAEIEAYLTKWTLGRSLVWHLIVLVIVLLLILLAMYFFSPILPRVNRIYEWLAISLLVLLLMIAFGTADKDT